MAGFMDGMHHHIIVDPGCAPMLADGKPNLKRLVRSRLDGPAIQGDNRPSTGLGRQDRQRQQHEGQ